VRVVELASILAAPSTSRLMADLGADVVKVEGPGGAGGGGDPLRTVTLPYEESYRQKRGVGTQFECLHAGKKSLCIDAKRQRDKLVELVRGADVFITNVRSHQLQEMGIDYDSLRAEAPQLVYAHLSAWGTTGPDQQLPGYDIRHGTQHANLTTILTLIHAILTTLQRVLGGHGDGAFDPRRVDARVLPAGTNHR